MGMTTHIVGFTPPDEEWVKMKAVWDSCAEAGISPPNEVQEYFNWKKPEAHGVETELGGCSKAIGNCGNEGYEVVVDKIPKNVKVIRIYNEW